MATIFKRKRDSGKKNTHWWIQYFDHNGERKTAKGYTDKRKTEAKAAKLEEEARLRRDKLIDPKLEKARDQRLVSLEDHLKAYETHLKKNSPKHVKLTMSRIRRIVNDACMETATDIDIESVEAVLTEMLEAEEIGYKTYNHYLQAIDSLCNWMVPKRMPSNPLLGIERLNAAEDVRHQRRALLPHEFEKLVVSARTSGVSIQCFDGEQRARIYLTSYMTGLRRKEIASLTPQSFDLDASPPTVTVEATASKHRKKDVLPLHSELVSMLRDWLKNVPQTEPLFPYLAKRRTWLMVKKDLERVGIPYRDDQNRVADFHAAGRHTHITELLRNGVSVTEAKELARHSDVRMTMKYTHIGIDDQAKAVAKLPAAPSWLHYGCSLKHANGHNIAFNDTTQISDGGEDSDLTPYSAGSYDTKNHQLALAGTTGESGGGGDRTRVPRYFHDGLYVCSRLFIGSFY